MNHKLLLATAVAASLAGTARAHDFSTGQMILPPTVVTATRTAQDTDETLAAVSVITREDIDSSQARSLYELLRGLPGIQLTSSGGHGKVSGLHLRGTNSSHVLMLVDGVRIGSATDGGIALQHLPLEAIERIEIVRGPRSSLYGTDAIGGIVHIFTHSGSAAPRWTASAGYGTHHTRQAGATVSGSQGKTAYALGINHFATDGYDSAIDNNPDRDGYRRNAINAQLGHRLNADNKIGFSLLRSDGKNDYDGYMASDDYRDKTVQQVLSAHWESAFSDTWHSRLTIGESRDEYNNYTNGQLSDRFHTRRQQATWQHDLQARDNLLVSLGADWLEDKIRTSSTYQRNHRRSSAGFAQGQLRLGAHDWLLGLRSDNISGLGTQTTGNLDWGIQIADGIRLSAGYGTAYKAPSFNDLYYQDPFGSSGNPHLKPEKSRSAEVGLRHVTAVIPWQLRFYQTRINNLIQWHEVAPFSWQPDNIGEAMIRGMELTLEHHRTHWHHAATLNLLDARNHQTDRHLPYRARQTLLLRTGYRQGALQGHVEWLGVSRRHVDADNARRLSGYGLINAVLHYDLGDLSTRGDLAARWRLSARVDNLLDRNYQEVDNYRTPGRTVFLSLAYRS